MKFRTLIAVTLSLAAVFAIPANAGWVDGFEGYSVFGATDASGGPVCPLCDSTVNFAVWQTEGTTWLDDSPFNANDNVTGLAFDDQDYLAGATNEGDALGGGTVDTIARFVLLYQVINTDPLDVLNPELENFNVTKTLENGDSIAHQPYSSGGFIDQVVFENAQLNNDDPDVPNNWVPGCAEGGGNCPDVTPFVDDDFARNPDSLQLTEQLVIASPSVRNGGEAYSGALFDFSPLQPEPPPFGTIPGSDPNASTDPFGTSSLLFLTFSPGISAANAPNCRTSNTCYERALGYVWLETESPGGFGAAGDGPGVKNAVPEPATLALLSLGLVGLGVARRRRKIV